MTVSQLRTPLTAAATLAEITDGDPEAFALAMEPYVGVDRSYASAVLYEIESAAGLATVGDPVDLGTAGEAQVDQLLTAARSEDFVIVDLLQGERHLGYAVSATGEQPRYVVYAERVLGADPYVRRRNDEPFANLNYAIYLGTEPDTRQLLGSSGPDLGDGRTASAVSPFGDQQLLLVMSATDHLSSGLFANLWWVVAVIGAAATFTVAALSRRLIVRHDEAVGLAEDNERLYDEQRQIAETLQLSLLPQVLEPPPGAVVAARYWPAGSASLIGGDFYDVFRVDERRWALALGDVCGKGIEAAAVTGLARHTLRAAARYSTSAADVLHSVHRAMADHRPSTFCTVCFIYVEVTSDGAQQLTMSLGGHPPALLRRRDGSVHEIGALGTLLGLIEPQLLDTVVDVHPGDTLVLYTDGLTDAPGDQAVPIEDVVALLQSDRTSGSEQLADSIRALKRARRPHGSGDDTVVLVMQFGQADPSAEASAQPVAGLAARR
jgi:serine phosphatase RsbU (regulator of sigma subunit)